MSAALKTTLTVGAGLTVTLPGKVVAYVAKASMAAWSRGEYTADLIDTSASMQRRISSRSSGRKLRGWNAYGCRLVGSRDPPPKG